MKEESKIIAITGATGWLGRNILDVLQQNIPIEEFNEKVVAFGSKEQFIYSTAYENNKLKIPVYPLNTISRQLSNKNIDLIHTAFLTPKKIKNIGSEEFKKQNNEIISCINKLVHEHNELKLVFFSSGISKKEIDYENESKSLYKNFKKHEESLLKKSPNLKLNLRIYAMTGKFSHKPYDYALTNFIEDAIKYKKIKLKNNGRVIRGFCNAQDLAKVAYCWIKSNDNSSYESIDAISHITSIENLAKITAKLYKSSVIFPNNNNCKSDDYYFDNPYNFINLLKKYKVKRISLIDQIISTRLTIN